MARITNPPSPLIEKLDGVHLFGFDGAPCSQRVSFALAEKGIVRSTSIKWADESAATLMAPAHTYVFRNVSLITHENMSEGFAKIQPNMVVPALVLNGELHIESMEIIDLIDKTWPEQPLFPSAETEAGLCRQLIDQGKALHVSVRYVSFHWSLGTLAKTDAKLLAQIERLQKEGSPEQLAEFYAKYNNDSIEEATFVEHLRALESGYAEQEQRLLSDGRPYLVGDQFTMADIIWSIKVTRLIECGYPLKRNFPILAQWYERVRARPGFRDGVMRHNRFFHHAFKIKAGIQNFFGRGIASASRSAASA